MAQAAGFSPRLYGMALGGALSALSWIGNTRLANTGVVSTFPDVVTLLVVPVAIYVLLRQRHRRLPARRVRELRRVGWSATHAAAIFYAVFATCYAAFTFHDWDVSLTAFVFAGTLIVTAGVGYVSTEVWARLLAAATVE